MRRLLRRKVSEEGLDKRFSPGGDFRQTRYSRGSAWGDLASDVLAARGRDCEVRDEPKQVVRLSR